ncbi:transport and Golgi organization protein 2 [Humitalea rosea]|uniref:Transport and Golgi organization protein 2 n=1 Tax=Humitalea rosea TaxID=990373 RepID=A0A2W7I1J9_9PROT|nr:NRDE family protein [Humitalea rosea]PZW40821.1 transport and Golgi organization protein 2 [Humitalea rosea]
MCTVLILRRPGAPWPLLLAANRDERIDRIADPPGPWWADRPGVIGGRDRSAGGSWMAIGPAGVVAAVLNRPGSLGPAPGKASRGGLPLLAADVDSAEAGAAALAALDAGAYRPFNALVADRMRAFFVAGLGHGHPVVTELAEGLTMVTSAGPNDTTNPRIARHLPRFTTAAPPEPPDWGAWPRLLADSRGAPGAQLHVLPREGFGTVSSSLLALGAEGGRAWRFHKTGEPWAEVPLPPSQP